MKNALYQAAELVIKGNEQLRDIVGTTMQMSLSSSLLALLIGVPTGVLLALAKFRGRWLLVLINRTLMGMPPVVCGLLCYILFSGVGPLRHLRLLYTVQGMVIAQLVLIIPVVVGNMEDFVSQIAPDIQETAWGMGLSSGKTALLVINESRYQIISVYLMAFSRTIAEVGAVSMVGGAIAYKTNVMTTAIMMYSNRGDLTLGLALGILLLVISFGINLSVYFLQVRVSK